MADVAGHDGGRQRRHLRPDAPHRRLPAPRSWPEQGYHPTARARGGWNTADDSLRAILQKDGLAQVRPWSEDVAGTVTARPIGSVRIGDDPAGSALGDSHELRRHRGLFVTDGSAVPASLTVNPSLTIAALAERAVPAIVSRAREAAADVTYGAPLPPSAT